MANKVWIVMLGFCAFFLTAIAIMSVVMALMAHEPIRNGLGGMVFFGLFAWRALDATRSRIKYGSKGPPPDPLANFHVDF